VPTLGRSLLIAFVIAGLVVLPVQAKPSAALGMVTQAQSAQVDRATAAGGASVYPGDTLETGADGLMRLRVGAAQFYLLALSTATLAGSTNTVTADLVQGTIGFSSTGSEAIEVRAEQAVIRPKTSQPTHARVTVISPNQLIVSSYRGPLELRVGDEVYSIPEMTSYRVDITATDEGSGRFSARKTHAVLVLIGLVAVAAVTAYVVHRALVSPNHP
jgi:hypothetical protein